MPTPITTNDPIFASIQSQVPASFLGDVVNLINRSPSLLGEIDNLDATTLSNGTTATIALQSGAENAGNSYYHSPVINIEALPNYDDSQIIYGGASLTAGQTEGITPAGTFVGLLAYELAHWGDAQLGPIYTPGELTSYTVEQAVATEFASEGKSAYSQYVAMSEIQASEASDPLPSTLINGNILFNVSSNALHDTGLLQQVMAFPQSGEPTDAVSYLGSQFWDVAVDGGTFISTMWNGYSNAGARDDLGIDLSTITSYQVSDQNGVLTGCTIEVAANQADPNQAALTYDIACSVPGQQQATILNSATQAMVATVDTVIPATGAMQLSITANDFTFAVAASASATLQGNGDTLSLGAQASLSLSGSADTVSGAAGNEISLTANGSSASVSGSGTSIQLDGAGQDVSATAATIALAPGASATVSGSNDSITMPATSGLSLAGTADTVSGTGATISLLGLAQQGVAQQVTLSGGQDTLFGAAGSASLQLALSGSDATISLASGKADITGGNATATIFGGASDLTYGGGGIVVMGEGSATIGGAASGARETVFGGNGGLVYHGDAEFADVIGGAGACTITAGTGGGWYAGGSAGDNQLTATGGGTVLEAGGDGDSLTGAASGGTYLIASSGNETLKGGNQTGVSSFFLGSGADQVVAGQGGSVIVTGAGSASINGGGGLDQIWGGSGASDLITAGTGGTLQIHGFRTGTDHVSAGGQSITTVSQNAAGVSFTLSSGTVVTLFGVDAQPGSVFV